MKRFRWLSVAILFIIVSSLLPLAFTGAAQADSGKINLQDLTNGADSVLVGTVVERNSYWNDEHTHIYTSVVMSVDNTLKGTANKDNVAITVTGGEVEGIGEMVSEMPVFDQGEQAVVFLKKLTAKQLPQAEAVQGQLAGEQYEVYNGYRGKFTIKGGRAGGLPEAQFKERVNSIAKGQTLPVTELDVIPPSETAPYLLTGASWPPASIPVPYRINENTNDCTGEGAAVQNAAATWSDAGANFSFDYAGTTTATAAGYDGVDAIIWRDLGNSNIVAMATWWYMGSTIVEADIEFNEYYAWSASTSCPSGYMDVQTVALHELGHWVGLADLYSAGDAAKVMYGYVSTGFTKRALTADDIAGIQSIYGASAPPSAPTVTNSTGASNISYTSARLNGELTSNGNASTTVHIYWGDHDGGTTPPGQPGGWDNDVNLGTTSVGTFYADIPSLTPNTDYYYRCHATNSAGYDWADATYHFKTPASVNFTIAALPDTQHYSAFYPQTFTTQTQWIKDNKTSKNIVFVTQEGDIIDTNSNTAQWANANTSMSLLDGQVPYGIAPGNHDGAPGETANFNTYFPYTRYSGQSWYGGHYGTDNDNSYQLFSVGGQHFIILHIEYGADSNVLSWADGILKAYPTHRAIVTSHYLLNVDGSFSTYGSNIYNALKGNSNLFLMLCGHMHGEASRMDIYNGNTVYTLLADYQERSNGGDGWLRVMEFSPTTNSISVKTYSPTLNQYETDADSQFEVSYTSSQKLIGANESTTPDTPNGGNHFILSRFTATASGDMTELKVRCSAPGNVKVAVYDDNSGEPGALLKSVDTSTPVSSGWNTIPFSSPYPSITSGNNYWLAFCSDGNIVGAKASTGYRRFKPAAFSSFTFPSNAGTGFITDTTYYDVTAGWGTIIPPTPPTITNSTGASNISSTSARLNGELTSNGNASTTVHIYWGTTDGGNTPGGWTHDEDLGVKPVGTFYKDISSLTPNTPYYYRCYASNSAGPDWADTSAQFTTLVQTQKIIGADESTTPDTPNGGNYFILSRFTATASGDMTELKVRCSAPGNVKVAVYDDNSGEPGALRKSVDTSTPVSSGWNTIPITPPIAVTSSTNYWLAFCSDGNIVGAKAGTGYRRFKPATFASFTFPSTAGTGFTINTTYYDLTAGWGTIVIAPLDITTTSLPNGSVGTPYSQTLQATGGTTPYTWSKTAGDLPAGLTLASTGIISGTPTTVGTYNFTVQVTDSTSPTPNSDTQALAITINPQTQKLIGADASTTPDTPNGGNYFILSRFTATASGDMTELKVRCSAPGNVKVAIYDDSSGSPNALLRANNSSTPASSGWNTIPITPSIAVTSSTNYWLAFCSDGSIVGAKAGTGNRRFKPATFTSFTFPSTAGTGFTTDTTYYDLTAGWGTIVPPPTPNLVSPTTTVNFQWSDPGGATKYWLQVNTSSNFDGTSLFDAELGAVTSQQVTGLANGTIYYWRVKAGNAGGWSVWSTTRSVTVNQL
jgi:hypothetical protein